MLLLNSPRSTLRCCKIYYLFAVFIESASPSLLSLFKNAFVRCSICFSSVARVEQEMKQDWLFAPHYRYYVREMRILAYSQLLESYRSLTLGYMAEAFGVSTEFIDQYGPTFISTSRLKLT